MGVVSMEFLFGVTDQMSVVGLSDSEVPKAVMLRLGYYLWLYNLSTYLFRAVGPV
jgi:hypothetical protein